MTNASPHNLTLALYQPDIPQNTGTILRACACLGFDAAIIGPTGFPSTDRDFRRAGMDYLNQIHLERHISYAAFVDCLRQEAPGQPRKRVILLTTKAERAYTDCTYQAGDILLVGRETAGVPDEVFADCDRAVKIPMRPPARSLNVAVAAAIVMSEALRQLSLSDQPTP